MKKFRYKILAAFALMALMVFPTVGSVTAATYSVAPAVYADSVQDACNGIGLTGGNCGGNSSEKTINTTIKTGLNILSTVVGIAAVIMIIVGGFKYITANGEASKLASARSTIIYAIVGLVIVALSQTIVHFVLNKV